MNDRVAEAERLLAECEADLRKREAQVPETDRLVEAARVRALALTDSDAPQADITAAGEALIDARCDRATLIGDISTARIAYQAAQERLATDREQERIDKLRTLGSVEHFYARAERHARVLCSDASNEQKVHAQERMDRRWKILLAARSELEKLGTRLEPVFPGHQSWPTMRLTSAHDLLDRRALLVSRFGSRLERDAIRAELEQARIRAFPPHVIEHKGYELIWSDGVRTSLHVVLAQFMPPAKPGDLGSTGLNVAADEQQRQRHRVDLPPVPVVVAPPAPTLDEILVDGEEDEDENAERDEVQSGPVERAASH